ncbi:MAG: DUF1329 domain-containing protein [Desulfobacterales bacterium]|nr:DUF1329 domain-containing protein [Desulfobacterales bacterium]
MSKVSIICFLALALSFGGAIAKVSKEEAAKLGNELTPLGATKAGNAEGTIPEWTGGLSAPPEGYVEGEVEPDPYADDKVLFTITAQNLDQYKDKLTPGQIAMFGAYPDTFKMNVYPTRRSAAYHQYVYDAARRNAENAEIDLGNLDLTNWSIAYPFPIPQNGLEAVCNHLLTFIPPHNHWISNQAVMTRSGGSTIVRMREDVMNLSSTEGVTPNPKRFLNFTQEILAPPRLAGRILLVHVSSNKLTHKQQAWVYNPGQRRVRRAPSVEYDGPGTAADGLRTSDDYLLYNGAPDRYNWELKGKKEIYIPYNCNKLGSKELKLKQLLMQGHLNQDYVRYELHRVSIVEGTLKEGMRHIYKKRVFYQDEDTWQIAVSDIYDNRDQLWRLAVSHSYQAYNVPYYNALTTNAFYDLQSRRYLVQNLLNEEGFVDYKTEGKAKDFTPAALRRRGRR